MRPRKRSRKVADIESISAVRRADGSIKDHRTARPIQVTVDQFTVTETLTEDGEVIERDFGQGANARLKYAFDDGTAWMSHFTDASSEASHANWTGFDFLRVLPAADEAVANVPGVEEVTPARTVLRKQIETGAEIEIDRGE